MGNRKRLKNNTQRAMIRRSINNKKPMGAQQKAERKKISEAQREKALKKG